MDPTTQEGKNALLAGVALGASDQKRGTQPASDRSHCPNSRRKCQPTRPTHQKQQPNHSQQPELSQPLTIRAWSRWRNGLTGPRQFD